MAGREWKDAITWILYFFKYCDPSEYQRVRACIFAHHCSRICGRIQVLLDANDHNAILHDLPSILEEVSGVEKESYPLSHKKAITDYIVKPPDIPYDLLDDLARSNDLFSQILQSSSRMKLSYHVLELLSRASTGASYATQQIIKPLQSRYIKEITAVADRLLSYLTPNSSSSFSTQIGGITDPSYQGRPEQDGPSRTVTFYSDLENDFNGKSTLSFNYRERGVEVIRFNFEDQKE